MKRFNDFLIRSKLADPDGTLSLSNIAMMVLVAKMALATSLDWVTMTAFFGVLLNHNAKKHWAKSKADKQIADSARLEKIEAEVRSVNQVISLKGLGR